MNMDSAAHTISDNPSQPRLTDTAKTGWSFGGKLRDFRDEIRVALLATSVAVGAPPAAFGFQGPPADESAPSAGQREVMAPPADGAPTPLQASAGINPYLPGSGVNARDVVRGTAALPGASADGSDSNLYIFESQGKLYHEPPFFFVVNPNAEENPDLPEIVFKERPSPGGSVFEIRVVITNPALKNFLATVFSRREGGNSPTNNGTSEGIGALSITDSYVVVSDAFDPSKIFGFAHTGGILGDDTARVYLEVSRDDRSRFLEACKKDELIAVWNYRYANEVVHSGKFKAVGSLDITSDMQTCFSSEQIAGTAPIFQKQKDDFCRRVSARYVADLDVDDDSLIPVIMKLAQDVIGREIFASEVARPLEELRVTYPEIEAQTAEYLAPLPELTREGFVKSDMTVTTDGESKRKEKGGGGGFSFLGIGAKASSKTIEEKVRAVENSTGVELTFDKESSSFKPHRIKVSKLVAGTQTLRLDSEIRAKVRGIASNEYVRSGNIYPSQTDRVLARAIGEPIVAVSVRSLDAKDQQIAALQSALNKERTARDADRGQFERELAQRRDELNRERQARHEAATRADHYANVLGRIRGAIPDLYFKIMGAFFGGPFEDPKDALTQIALILRQEGFEGNSRGPVTRPGKVPTPPELPVDFPRHSRPDIWMREGIEKRLEMMK